jgi:GH18 family chitinase
VKIYLFHLFVNRCFKEFFTFPFHRKYYREKSFLATLTWLSEMATNKIVSAYYSYNPSPTELQPEEINGAILTNLLVGWTYVSQQTGACLPTSPLFLDGFRKCTQLRAKFPHLKVSLVCGDGANFSKMANSPALRGVFVQSAIALLESCGFDGLDLDWEFPVFNGKKYDRQNFVTLLRELRSAFQAHCPQYLLTIAVAAQKPIAVRAYDIPAIAPLIDFANIMCYDYNLFKPYNIWAGHNAPLFQRLNQRGIFATLNTVRKEEAI